MGFVNFLLTPYKTVFILHNKQYCNVFLYFTLLHYTVHYFETGKLLGKWETINCIFIISYGTM